MIPVAKTDHRASEPGIEALQLESAVAVERPIAGHQLSRPGEATLELGASLRRLLERLLEPDRPPSSLIAPLACNQQPLAELSLPVLDLLEPLEQLQVDTLLMHGVRTAHLEKEETRCAFHRARLRLERRVHPGLDQLAQRQRS